MWKNLLLAVPFVLPACALAQSDAADDYVAANLLSIFYHELGHAMIDVMALPVFGQEEDAADTASILLIHAFYEEETAQDIARHAAFGFLDEADSLDGDAPVWWDEHGPDLQRYYNLVCLFYGADPNTRDTLAEDLGLPPERAESCAEEFDLAADSWGPVLDELEAAGPGETLIYSGDGDSFTQILIADEVAALNATLSLPDPVTVTVEPCAEANAFYDPNARGIIICTELESHLRAFVRN